MGSLIIFVPDHCLSLTFAFLVASVTNWMLLLTYSEHHG